VHYSPEAGGRAVLIDFDGVGKYGRDRYSPCLISLGVLRWQIMEKSHDESNLERIISWLSTMQYQMASSAKPSDCCGAVRAIAIT